MTYFPAKPGATGAAGATTLPVSNTYTAAGAIAITDRLAVINLASAGTMTLAAGTVDGFVVNVKRIGAGVVSLTANIDGTSQTLVMDATAAKESLSLAWASALGTYLIV